MLWGYCRGQGSLATCVRMGRSEPDDGEDSMRWSVCARTRQAEFPRLKGQAGWQDASRRGWRVDPGGSWAPRPALELYLGGEG